MVSNTIVFPLTVICIFLGTSAAGITYYVEGMMQVNSFVITAVTLIGSDVSVESSVCFLTYSLSFYPDILIIHTPSLSIYATSSITSCIIFILSAEKYILLSNNFVTKSISFPVLDVSFLTMIILFTFS